MSRPSVTLSICMLAAAVALVGLFRSGTGPSTAAEYGAPTGPGATPSVEIADFAFSGLAATAGGTTITVTNADAAAHTLTARTGDFDTGVLGGGATTSIVLPTAPGTYEFFCELHPSMTGSLTVS